MSAAIAIDPYEIEQISKLHTVSLSQLRMLARKAEALAIAIEKRWEDFSPQERELLEVIVYDPLVRQDGNCSLFFSLQTRLSLAWILIRGETTTLTDYLNALLRLKNAIVNAVERTDPSYEQKMTEAVKEAFVKSDENARAMTPDEFCEWLTSVSD